MRRAWITGYLAGCVCSLAGMVAAAEWPDWNWRGDSECRMERAGFPCAISRWARPRNEPQDVGYYVGGGAARGGEGRYCHEGTWGWDYEPKWTRVRLDWWHGRRAQGGEGQYEPDEKNAPLTPLFKR